MNATGKNPMLEKTFQNMVAIFSKDNKADKEESEHCPGCGSRTGNGSYCVTCEDQRQKELSKK